MTDRRWKRAEREIAKALGTTRLPNNGAGQPDCRAGGCAYQIKTTTGLPRWLTDAVDQAARDADEEETPVVILNEVSQGRKARRLVVLTFEDWRALLAAPGGRPQ